MSSPTKPENICNKDTPMNSQDLQHENAECGNADRPGNSAQTATSSQDDNRSDDRSRFECIICLECAQDPVVTRCGHLYCWPCLHTWIDTRRDNPLCPACKSVISKDEVTPIYGKNSDNVDPRTKHTIPPRPQGQRTEDPTGGQGSGDAFGFPWNYQQNGMHANVHFSFGFGLFPFSFVASFLNGNGANIDHNGGEPDAVRAHNDMISNIFLGLGFGFLLWLIFT